jgi:apolipoprotein N-acyltransferase
MLPPFESNLKPGRTLTVLRRLQQISGIAICKDMDFESPARLYGETGTGLILVPAWDFVVDRSWHGHIGVMRGSKTASASRAAKNGFLTVGDNRGRIIGEVISSSAPFATLLVDVPAPHSWTVYRCWATGLLGRRLG